MTLQYNLQIPVTHHLVVFMQNAELMETCPHALVYQHTSDHLQIVDLNVLSTLIAHLVRPASMKSVKILATELVVLTQNVMFKTIFRFVVAEQVLLEIHSLSVFKLLLKNHQRTTILAILLLVVQTLNASMENAHVYQNTEEIHSLDADQNAF